MERLLTESGISGVSRVGRLDRTHKHWDIKTDDITIEVKTATLGRTNATFQHENIEKDRNYDVLVFVDIAPNDVYLSWFTKCDVQWKSLHRRANSNFYKWDIRLNKVIDNRVSCIEDIRKGYCSVSKLKD